MRRRRQEIVDKSLKLPQVLIEEQAVAFLNYRKCIENSRIKETEVQLHTITKCNVFTSTSKDICEKTKKVYL